VYLPEAVVDVEGYTGAADAAFPAAYTGDGRVSTKHVGFFNKYDVGSGACRRDCRADPAASAAYYAYVALDVQG